MNKLELKKELKALGIVVKDNKIKRSDIQKILGSPETIRHLMQALYSMLGNKRYLHDLEELLKDKLGDLTPEEDHTLVYLMRDLNDFQHGTSRKDLWNYKPKIPTR